MTLAEHNPRPDSGDPQPVRPDGMTGMIDKPRPVDEMHPEVQRVLNYFRFGHLPGYLAMVSRPFCDLAWDLAGQFSGPQLIVTLQSLLRAKDDAVRCALDVRAAELRPLAAQIVQEAHDVASLVMDAHNAGGTARG